jgi:hypothetical protein
MHVTVPASLPFDADGKLVDRLRTIARTCAGLGASAAPWLAFRADLITSVSTVLAACFLGWITGLVLSGIALRLACLVPDRRARALSGSRDRYSELGKAVRALTWYPPPRR